MNIEIDGIVVEITKKRIKTLRLSVSRTDGKVRMSVPYGVSDRQIYDFIYSKLDWIRKHTGGGENNLVPTKIPYNQRKTLAMWGADCVLEIFESDCDRAFFDGGSIKVGLRDVSSEESFDEAVKELYRGELSAKLEELVPEIERRLGLYSSSVTIRAMKSRWGSCSPQSGRIRINLELAKLPQICLEYVILHELAHLKYPNHKAEFKAYLSEHMPNWREIKDSMRPV